MSGMESPPEGLCKRCNENPPTQRWVGNGGALALSHGFYEWWCERCVVEEQLDHAKERAKEVQRLETKLFKLGGPAPFVACNGFAQDSQGVYRGGMCVLRKGHKGECSADLVNL